MASVTCYGSNGRQLEMIHYLHGHWDPRGWHNAMHEIWLAYNTAPGILYQCHAGNLQAPLWGTVNETFRESRDGQHLQAYTFSKICGGTTWRVQFEARNSWSAS